MTPRFLCWCHFVYNTPQEHPRITKDELKYLQSTTSTKSKKRQPVPWLKIFKSRPFWALGIFFFVYDWSISVVSVTIPQYLNDVLNYNISDNGFISALPVLVRAIVSQISAKVEDLLISKKVISSTMLKKVAGGVGFLANAGFFIAVNYIKCNRTLGVVFITVGFGMLGIATPVALTNAIEMTRDHASVVMGIHQTFGAVAFIITAYGGGAITNQGATRENWAIIFYCSAGVLIVSLLVYLVFGSAELQDWDSNDEEVEDTKEQNDDQDCEPASAVENTNVVDDLTTSVDDIDVDVELQGIDNIGFENR